MNRQTDKPAPSIHRIELLAWGNTVETESEIILNKHEFLYDTAYFTNASDLYGSAIPVYVMEPISESSPEYNGYFFIFLCVRLL